MDEMKPLICFDLDSTIINSDIAHVFAYNKALKELGLPTRKPKEIYKHFGKPKEWVARDITPKGTTLELRKKLDVLKRRYLINEGFYKKAKRIPEAIPTIKKLKKRYKIAILSNCGHRNIRYLLRGAGIDINLFDFIIGNNDVKHSKPYPDELFKAEKIAKEKASYMVGDSIYDVRAGKRAKVKTIAVVTGHNSLKQLQKEKPYKIIKSIKELLEVLG